MRNVNVLSSNLNLQIIQAYESYIGRCLTEAEYDEMDEYLSDAPMGTSPEYLYSLEFTF
tara:strand:- start:308 stop:484 length:177 start_codon:yes stop_codon:yes gene_type:complete